MYDDKESKEVRVTDDVHLVGSRLGQLEDELWVLQEVCHPAL